MSSSTWLNAGSGDWDNASNWSDGVPDGTATFGASSQTQVSFSVGGDSINEISFASGAPQYTFNFTASDPSNPVLKITGQVSNASGLVQSFVVAAWSSHYQNAQLAFSGANAGDASVSYTVGPSSPSAPGGGAINFTNASTAGSATFTVTAGGGQPTQKGLVGGEVAFSDTSNAGQSSFTIYGSTSTVNKGDTFGNVVFHDGSSAANAAFTNMGGTVGPGDGGNTQFYETATAANGSFEQLGGVVSGANGGDVAFDGTATAGYGVFNNRPALVSGANGGVVSFNNNWAPVGTNADAGNGQFYNHGANGDYVGGGGHTEFTGKYGNGNAANAIFNNYGSSIWAGGKGSIAGHTIFSVSSPNTNGYQPSAGNAVFNNYGGTGAGAPGGYTEFTVYTDDGQTAPADIVAPTAANGTFYNCGSSVDGGLGGSTIFSGNATAANATLVASGGTNGGLPGKVVFSGQSCGSNASVQLSAGVLDITGYSLACLSLSTLSIANTGSIYVMLSTSVPYIAVSQLVMTNGAQLAFAFYSRNGYGPGQSYQLLTASNLSDFSLAQFTGSPVGGYSPTFSVQNGTELWVTF